MAELPPTNLLSAHTLWVSLCTSGPCAASRRSAGALDNTAGEGSSSFAALKAPPTTFRSTARFKDSQGRRLENFSRVERFGDNQANGNNDAQWIKVTVDARTREVFSYQAQIVPANRVAVPAP